jgi:hypothetical protein
MVVSVDLMLEVIFFPIQLVLFATGQVATIGFCFCLLLRLDPGGFSF